MKVGLALMIGSQAATFAGVEPFASWNTPIVWTGFILFADALVYRARGTSWLRTAPREFAFLSVISIPLWLVFEFFNLFIDNWYYVGLPEHRALRTLGYAWSFATIWPAIFEGAELVSVWRGASMGAAVGGTTRLLGAGRPRRLATISVAVGTLMLLWPLVWPSRYLAAPVWLGFILLLDPLNWLKGRESLAGDFGAASFGRLWNLVLSGFLCGILWEFWNYWARAKWHYTVPIMEDLKIFEMPLPGYLGFPAFALECFAMYVFVRAACLRVLPGFSQRVFTVSVGPAESPQLGRTIAL
jgi:hypothetical protein